MTIIVGASVGGGLFLIILLCAIVVVFCRRKTSNQNHQQQALPEQPQPQPQQQRAHKDVTEQGYINDHMAPNSGIPLTTLADNVKYLQATPDRGIPTGPMEGDGNYVNAHMVAQYGIPFNMADN